jgi:hypothetical protein
MNASTESSLLSWPTKDDLKRSKKAHPAEA